MAVEYYKTLKAIGVKSPEERQLVKNIDLSLVK